MAHALDAAAGTIYDIGYRNYEGARLGRGYAFRTLFVHSLRSLFGLGRGGKALIIPWGLFACICLPAVVSTAVTGMTQGLIKNLIDYHQYFSVLLALLVALFCAAQAPELVSNDQHHRVLPLYFSRALRKHDYAFAKLLAMWTAVFILTFTPLLILLTGRLGLPAEFWPAFKEESKNFLPILATPAVCALVFGTLAVSLASYVTRRGLASALVLGLFLLTAPLVGILMETVQANWSLLMNPILVVTGAIWELFGERHERGSPMRQADLAPEVYYAVVMAYAVVFALLLLNRYRRIST